MNVFILLGLFAATGLGLESCVLWLAARLSRLDRVKLWRAALVVVFRSIIATGLFVILLTADAEREWLAMAGLIVVDAAVTFWLIGRVFGGTWRKQAGAWALNIVAGTTVGFLFAAAFTTCLAGSAWVNSSMTPNIRGYHVVETLADGTHLIHAANFPGDGRGIPPGGPSGAIVAETYEYREVPRPAVHTHTADRVLCNKTKFPDRWDAIVVRFENEPTFNSVKRLVGLPGERIQIRERSVWVDGEPLTPPARLGPIRYESLGSWRNEESSDFEITLGPDEYFVLGDNTNRSLDSRIRGPVRRNQIVGVVDLIYWPPSRWRVRP
jgi:signal peptidase I